MEDVGAQVASPMFIHHQPQHLVARFCEPHQIPKKRPLPFQPQHQHQHLHQHQYQHPNRSDNWNPNAWNWDSMRFLATSTTTTTTTTTTATQVVVQPELHTRGERQIIAVDPTNTTRQDDENLSLKLGGTTTGGGGLTSAAVVEAQAPARPSKRVRSGSPGVATYPMCQVDDCKEDLSTAKDYHRRHKVCQVHSKATKALVGKQMQRFCQQCSRFHTLPEFDEGKRSCRRRLAGHNRRRRKTQPEEASARALLPGNNENNGGKSDLDIVNLLAVLARAQGSTGERGTNFTAVPDKDQLMQILSKLNSLPLPANLIERISGCSNKSISNQASPQAQNSLNGNTPSPSTRDLLGALSASPPRPATDVREVQSEGSSRGSDSEKSKSSCMDHDTCLNLNNVLALELPSVGGARSSSSNHSPVEDSDSHMQEPHLNLPLQLFSSSPEIDSIPKLAPDRKYFSSGSSNPSVDRSPSTSPPVVTKKLFPMPTVREKVKPGTNTTSLRGNGNVTYTRATGDITSLQLFGGSSTGADNGSSQSSPYQAGYTSSSGSDHSPSSLNSDAQDRTGRILFKLFDKNPSHLPETLKSQIYNWLSNSPSEIEGYIRPGCVVLSIYVSMSSSAWDQLEENLYECVKSLVDDIDCDFWRNGRFLVHTLKQLASHKSGKIRLCKSWRVWSSPELISVSPVAVVSGQETSLVLRGRNLTVPGTRITCTHTSGYTTKHVPGPAFQQATYDEISLGSFRVCGADTSSLGRCFIEVENGFRGASFPVIIADAAVCQELRLLEFEVGRGSKVGDTITANDVRESWMPSSREETLHFLNELGWLFQRKSNSFLLETPDYKLGRFKFLFVFSIEHDFCALVKTLLDILLEINLARKELSGETLEMLSEIHLLNRAVKRRCKNMVNLLLHFSVFDSNGASKYIFPPNLVGPGGITPLHVAASMSNSDDLVDALTSDRQEIGLHCWNSLLDSNGLSPYAYALMRNNHSYNKLVAQKVAIKENPQISVTIGDEIELAVLGKDRKQRPTMGTQGQNSCSKCASAAARYSRRVPGSQGLLHRPYIHSMLAIAAVCVCVCLLFRGAPDIGSVAPFKWEKLDFGTL